MKILELELIQRWKAHGINCGLAVGHMGMLCGYVQVPQKLRSFYAIEESVESLDVHGGITYEMDPEGWIGFDTGHYQDSWSIEDRKKYCSKAQQRELCRAMTVAPSLKKIYCEGPRLWTMEKIMAETERLAKQIKQKGE